MEARPRPTLHWLILAVVLSCADPPKASTPPDASAPPPPSTPAREGCARSGTFESLEGAASCVVTRANEDAMRAALKHLAISLEAEPREVVAGSAALLVLTVRNTSAAEVTLFLEARQRAPGPRTDWSRVAGVPEPHPVAAEVPRLLFPTMTTDADGRDVDALPTLSSGGGAVPSATLYAVHLRPGAKLTRNASWWAVRIPAPAPIVTDDAGHRYVPKTTGQSLAPGEYGIAVELPFFGLGREERKVTTRVRVIKPPPL